MEGLIQDRTTAGRDLAAALLKYRKRSDVIVIALPRGGVPVGAEVAHALHAPLDILVVRKLGVPGHEELAMGAIAAGGIRVFNSDVVTPLRIGDDAIERVAERAQLEIDRRIKAYRGERPWPDIEGRRVIIADDGIATGATMRAAIAALRAQGPAKIIVAVPVAPFHTLAQVRREADEVACLATPESLDTIGDWYWSFPQLDDDQVHRILSARWAEEECISGAAARAAGAGASA